MRFPRMSRSSTRPSAATQPNSITIPCTYHGWVMLPPMSLHHHRASQRAVQGGGGGNEEENDGADDSMHEARRTAYETLVQMAKRVGVAQMSKSRSRKAERAGVTITDGGIRVVGKKQDAGAVPLLHASINTVICTLVSKRSGVAVIVAHTWDAKGNRGIGCDVIRMKMRGCTTFKSAVKAAVSANVSVRQDQESASLALRAASPPPPYAEVDAAAAAAPAASAAPTRLSTGRGRRSSTRPAIRRRRSTAADNDEGGCDGYVGVEAFLASGYAAVDDECEPEYAEIGRWDDNGCDAAYMDICGPAMQSGYMVVESSSAEEGGGYMDVQPHPFGISV